MNLFDPMAVAADWMNFYRSGKIEPLLDLYDDEASVECDCDTRKIIVGKAAIGEYWVQRLVEKPVFDVTDVKPDGERVVVSYLTRGGVVRAILHFSSAGKIEHCRCGPAD